MRGENILMQYYFKLCSQTLFKYLYFSSQIIRFSCSDIQCVSVDSTSFVIYPELEATEVKFSALKRYLCSFYFRIDNETGRIQ